MTLALHFFKRLICPEWHNKGNNHSRKECTHQIRPFWLTLLFSATKSLASDESSQEAGYHSEQMRVSVFSHLKDRLDITPPCLSFNLATRSIPDNPHQPPNTYTKTVTSCTSRHLSPLGCQEVPTNSCTPVLSCYTENHKRWLKYVYLPLLWWLIFVVPFLNKTDYLYWLNWLSHANTPALCSELFYV